MITHVNKSSPWCKYTLYWIGGQLMFFLEKMMVNLKGYFSRRRERFLRVLWTWINAQKDEKIWQVWIFQVVEYGWDVNVHTGEAAIRLKRGRFLMQGRWSTIWDVCEFKFDLKWDLNSLKYHQFLISAELYLHLVFLTKCRQEY